MEDRFSCSTEADYDWAEEWESLGFCIALVEGNSPEAVLRQLVANTPTGVVPVGEAREWAWAQHLTEYVTTVEATVADGWVVSVELNGYQATLPLALTDASTGTRAVVVYRNVNAHMSFHWAVDGRLVRSFDPLLYDNRSFWNGEPLREEAGLPFGHRPLSSSLACAERLTGVSLGRDWLEQREEWIAIGHYPG